jgi:hypothetical protein
VVKYSHHLVDLRAASMAKAEKGTIIMATGKDQAP